MNMFCVHVNNNNKIKKVVYAEQILHFGTKNNQPMQE